MIIVLYILGYMAVGLLVTLILGLWERHRFFGVIPGVDGFAAATLGAMWPLTLAVSAFLLVLAPFFFVAHLAMTRKR